MISAMPTTRRQLLLGGASVAGAAALPPRPGPGPGAAATASRPAAVNSLPDPAASGIDHIVVMCMENRSFDHFLGWLPGANGRQAGLAYPDKNGTPHP